MALGISTLLGACGGGSGTSTGATPTPPEPARPIAGLALLAGQIGSEGNLDGNGSEAHFTSELDIAVDQAGNLYVTDSGNYTIRKISPDGDVTTLAGKGGEQGYTDGAGSTARFRTPIGLSIDGDGNLFVTDTGNHTVRQISPDGRVSTAAGQAGKVGVQLGSLPGSLATPSAIAAGAKGVLYISSANGVLKIQL